MMALISNLPFSHLDDEEFALMLHELQNDPVHFDHDRLSNLLFNPLTSNLDRYLIRPEDIDPNAHVKTHSRWDYYIQDKFNEMLHSEIRSLRNKLHDPTILLANLDIRFSIVGITETWLQGRNLPIMWISTGTILFTKTAHLNQADVLDCTCQII